MTSRLQNGKSVDFPQTYSTAVALQDMHGLCRNNRQGSAQNLLWLLVQTRDVSLLTEYTCSKFGSLGQIFFLGFRVN